MYYLVCNQFIKIKGVILLKCEFYFPNLIPLEEDIKFIHTNKLTLESNYWECKSLFEKDNE